MLSIATAALAFSAPVSKTVDSKVAAASAAAALSLIAMPAFAGDAGAGEAVFSGNCAACHAGGQNVIMPEKTLEKAVRAIGQIFPRPDSLPRANMSYCTTSSPRRARAPSLRACDYWLHALTSLAAFASTPNLPQALEEYLDGGFNDQAVMKQVTNGKNAMPAFGGRLSEEDIANVASYVIKTSSAGW